ncbi:MBL fold metallo-hydrolase [Psychromonas hadalis]|uniref:MBL fold metallo-hydrolase n=1 Tax=Psychromonas hadalis TaxID=211669 RepID=UPI0003B3EA42|nr:MBL fold metallo-hydrolase [Psychromonas hadalis]
MSERLTITVLVDNNVSGDLQAEHGFAVLIEHNNQRILFDAGQNEALFYNAKKLGIQLTGLDEIILSHGHYDHGGNLEWLLKNNPNANLHLHPDCLQTRYSIDARGIRNIALSESAVTAIKNTLLCRVKANSQPSQVTSAINLTGQIERKQPLELCSGPFYLDKQADKEDLLLDDQSLWINTKQGIVIITGCCHAGIENTVTKIQKQSSTQQIHTILGGLHLHNARSERLQHSADFLQSLQLKQLYPGHCTGKEAQALLKERLGEKVVQRCEAGLTVSFDIYNEN